LSDKKRRKGTEKVLCPGNRGKQKSPKECPQGRRGGRGGKPELGGRELIGGA